MEIHFQGEVFRENENYKIDGDDRDLVFDYTKIVIRGNDDQFFLATTKLRMGETSKLDLESLDRIVCQSRHHSATLLSPTVTSPDAATPVPQDSYVKETCLVDYDETPEPLSKLVLHEIEAYQLEHE
ncbi:hypothetical protein E4U17_000721 [Claviceps sp. LM77 group G4]|nr:hypothetical protein E4U17_000721 [Claviceps sp. LM77 group G4]KAG6070840.1 hypothetical protein E4U16_006556 [Claviceps sp. LM84 group G4]KAG6074966.1 hypothetical protein E4U33_002254 [Claviceps sp. LM78 group G4]